MNNTKVHVNAAQSVKNLTIKEQVNDSLDGFNSTI